MLAKKKVAPFSVEHFAINIITRNVRKWSRPLVNVYEVRAAWCICSLKSCVIHAERFRGELLSMGRYTNLSTFTFTSVIKVGR